MNQPLSNSHKWSIVAANKFIKATRDSGYSSTASAISELVDNSIQAGATRVRVEIEQEFDNELSISVRDNGCGMDLFTLRQALRFGGSSRFNDRTGLGRFGMGLPNSSLSQARRVIVTSWSTPKRSCRGQNNVLGSGGPLQTYLDIDEIASGTMTEVPKPRKPRPNSVSTSGRSGTFVQWESCDRLEFKRASTIARHVERELSQRFRYFLSDRVTIRVNNSILRPIDPMFLIANTPGERSRPYGKEILYTIMADPNDQSSDTGVVRVRFAELPVNNWAGLGNEEKRRKGIISRAGTSVIRGGREVDYGWFFFGTKRKENYDDWWRCEVSFDPILDEAFGLTHTKQQIRPQQYLLDILTPDMELTARTLNARARIAHGVIKASDRHRRSELIAKSKSRFLEPFNLKSRQGARPAISTYRIEEGPVENNCFYTYRIHRDTFVLTLDPDHAFYREIYAPLRDADNAGAEQVRTLLELLLLAAARSEASSGSEDAQVLADFRASWSKTAETLIGG